MGPSSQSYPTLCDPMNCSLPHSSDHRIFQARVLKWVTISFSRVSSQPKDWTRGLLHCGQMLYCLSRQRSPVSEKSYPSKNWNYKRKKKKNPSPSYSFLDIFYFPFPSQPGFLRELSVMFVPFPHCPPIPRPTQPDSYPHHSTEISHTKLQMISQLLNSTDTMPPSSLYIKIGQM